MTIVLYDDQCPICQWQVRLIQRLDWLGCLRLVGMTSTQAAALAPQIPMADLQQAMHCVSTERKVCRGARCFRSLAMQVPLLLPLGLLLWVPGVIHLAEWIYRNFSRRRYRISRWLVGQPDCHQDTCQRQPPPGPAAAPRRATTPQS